MKTKHPWQVTRSGIARTDGERRWDYAYQFLLQWAMEPDTGSRPVPSPSQKEQSHGSRPVCPGFDHSPATGSDD
jgi:hypothetical protein